MTEFVHPTGPPRISAHGRRYTFTIRRGFRFARTGAPVRAASFAAAINRVLDPRMRSAGAIWVQDVVGAHRVQAGQAKTASGIRYNGDTLAITVKNPAPDLPARLALVFFCSIPVNTPHDPNGVTPPTAGPYHVSHLDANTEVLRRNPYYRGHRPRHPANIVYKFSQPLNAIPLEIERGEVDTGVLFVPEADAKQYPKLFHVATGIIVTCLALNNDRPLFKNNLRLRKALNYAIDRKALDQQFGYPPLRPTDQYLAAAMPGFNDARIYPFKPNLKKARALARGHLGSGQAIMYYRNSSPTALARARIVQYDLSRIGLSVELKGPTGGAAGNRGEPFDIVDIGCVFPGYVDPFASCTTSSSTSCVTFASRAIRRPSGGCWGRCGRDGRVNCAGCASTGKSFTTTDLKSPSSLRAPRSRHRHAAGCWLRSLSGSR